MIVIKSKSDIELMRRSGEITALALEKIKEAVKPGVTTAELNRIAEEVIKNHSAIPSFKGYKGIKGSPNYPASVCASVNNEVVHGIPNSRLLNSGDIVSIDIGVFKEGFHSDAARTFAVGDISESAQRLIDVTKQSFYEGIKHALVGKRIGDISAAIQMYVESNGYSVVRDYVGHGIGRNIHEPPQIPNYISRERGPRLEAGMALAIEPMVNEGAYQVKLLKDKWTVITADGSLSAHYENTVIITDEGSVILTKLG